MAKFKKKNKAKMASIPMSQNDSTKKVKKSKKKKLAFEVKPIEDAKDVEKKIHVI